MRTSFFTNGSDDTLSMPGTIVVAEDEDLIRDLLVDTLKSEGYLVQAATDGAVALTTVRQALPNLLLLDLMMPCVDGYEVLGQIRAEPRTRSLPVIVLSAWDLPGHREKAFEAGCDAFIGKPFDLDDVISEVQKFVLKS